MRSRVRAPSSRRWPSVVLIAVCAGTGAAAVTPAAAQTPWGGPPRPHTAGPPGWQQPIAPSRSGLDIIDFRDAAEAADLPRIASVGQPVQTAGGQAQEPGTILCVAGCYDDDKRVWKATGGPTPAVTIARLRERDAARVTLAVARPTTTLDTLPVQTIAKPSVGPKVAAAPKVARAPVVVEAVRPALRRSFVAHTKRTSAKKVAARKSVGKVARAKPVVVASRVAVVAPTPPLVSPAPAHAPAPSVVAAKPVAAEPPRLQPVDATARPVASVTRKPEKRRVVSTSNDWFNKINREREAKKQGD